MSAFQIDLVEIDKQVVDACRNTCPQAACKLDDSRVAIYYGRLKIRPDA